MAFEIVDGKLVKTTKFGTAAQKRQGRKITGTLGVISGPPTKQAAARKISQVFNPPAPAPEPSGPITLERSPRQQRANPFQNLLDDPFQATAEIFFGPNMALDVSALPKLPKINTGPLRKTLSNAAAFSEQFSGIGGLSGTLMRGAAAGINALSQLAEEVASPAVRLPQGAGTTPASQLVSPHTGRSPSGTPAPSATEKQLSYLDTLRATDPDRALEVARFQSATIGRNRPESALAMVIRPNGCRPFLAVSCMSGS